MQKILNHEGLVFEVVDFIPYGYHIWNIGKNMKEDYLPLVQVGGYDGCQVIGIMKALPLKGAQIILNSIGYGNNTAQKMQEYIQSHEGEEGIEQKKEALRIMLTIKGIENLEQGKRKQI